MLLGNEETGYSEMGRALDGLNGDTLLTLRGGMIGFTLHSGFSLVCEPDRLGAIALAAVEVRPFPAGGGKAEEPSIEAMVPEQEPGKATLIRKVDEDKLKSASGNSIARRLNRTNGENAY